MPLALSVHADSSAAIGICRRSGIGRVRHLAVCQLWDQDHLRRGTFQLFKVRGDENPADLCTTYLARAAIDGLIEICGVVRETGRAASAPRLNVEVEPLPTKSSRGPSILALLSSVHCSRSFLAPSLSMRSLSLADSCILAPAMRSPRTLPRPPTDLHVPALTTRPPRRPPRATGHHNTAPRRTFTQLPSEPLLGRPPLGGGAALSLGSRLRSLAWQCFPPMREGPW